MSDKNCKVSSQLEDYGVILDAKWAFNPVKVYKPQRKQLMMFWRDLDGMQACNRFLWRGVAKSIPAERIEQMLYYRGALVFFKQGKEFRLLPFAAAGNLNMYALSNKVQPIAYNGGGFDPKQVTNIGEAIDVNLYDERDKNKGVILWDRQNGAVESGGIIPNIVLQSTIITEIVNRLSMLNVNLVNSQGKNIIVVKDPKQKNAVEKALSNIYASDKSYAVVKSMFDIQVINNEVTYEEQALWEDIQSWNNLRLEHLGVNNNGLFNKKERELKDNINADSEQTETISDGYYEARKKFVRDVLETFGDDPDFQEQFGDLEVIDLRVEHKARANKQVEDNIEEVGEYDSDVDIMF